MVEASACTSSAVFAVLGLDRAMLILGVQATLKSSSANSGITSTIDAFGADRRP